MLRIVIPNQLILNSQIPRSLFICYKTNTTTSVSRSVYLQFANTKVISYLYPGINNVAGVLHLSQWRTQVQISLSVSQSWNLWPPQECSSLSLSLCHFFFFNS